MYVWVPGTPPTEPPPKKNKEWLVQVLDSRGASKRSVDRFPERTKPWVSESRHGQTPCAGNRQGRGSSGDRASLHSHALGLQTP